MTPTVRRVVGVGAAALALLASASVVTAHPLGNYTVNRAIHLSVAAGGVAVLYVIDMAEIPAFSELQVIDRDGDGLTEPDELATYAAAACVAVRSNVALQINASKPLLQSQGQPQLSFPAGAGGLSTLRLVCTFNAAIPDVAGDQTVSVGDRTDDGHVGWREVVISAGPGVTLETSDVPSVSSSAELTSYPVDALQTPPDVRSGTAHFHRANAVSYAPGGDDPVGPATPAQRATANDPLAALVGGDLTPTAALGALLLALLLGAGHAVSPGHGKTLIAAYLIGSRGSVRHAATLGVTVAVTHTAGVFLLGAVTLLIGQFFVPERVIEWLSIGSGVLVALLGIGLVLRAIRGARHRPSHAHGDGHPHPHAHPHPHPHPHGEPRVEDLKRRNVITLGLAGGMVPSASALIVFLVAITTGRLIFGLLLIVAFGAGMAVVLGGMAVVTTALRGAIRPTTGLSAHPWARLAMSSLPFVSGIAVLVAGLSVSIGALARFA